MGSNKIERKRNNNFFRRDYERERLTGDSFTVATTELSRVNNVGMEFGEKERERE